MLDPDSESDEDENNHRQTDVVKGFVVKIKRGADTFLYNVLCDSGETALLVPGSRLRKKITRKNKNKVSESVPDSKRGIGGIGGNLRERKAKRKKFALLVKQKILDAEADGKFQVGISQNDFDDLQGDEMREFEAYCSEMAHRSKSESVHTLLARDIEGQSSIGGTSSSRNLSLVHAKIAKVLLNQISERNEQGSTADSSNAFFESIMAEIANRYDSSVSRDDVNEYFQDLRERMASGKDLIDALLDDIASVQGSKLAYGEDGEEELFEGDEDTFETDETDETAEKDNGATQLEMEGSEKEVEEEYAWCEADKRVAVPLCLRKSLQEVVRDCYAVSEVNRPAFCLTIEQNSAEESCRLQEMVRFVKLDRWPYRGGTNSVLTQY